MKLKGSIVIAFCGRKYLMVRHGTREWEFPGGRMEGYENPLETAMREFTEETGLKGTGWKECGIAKLVTGNLALFTCNVAGIPVPQTNEIVEAGYFTALPMNLSFDRSEYFQLLGMAGRGPKPKTDYDIASREFDNVRGQTATDDCWTDAIMKWGDIASDSRVLDIGCGTGRHALCVRNRCEADILGLDYSSGMLEKANVKASGIWCRGDAARLPFADWTFDRAIMILVLQHMDDEPAVIFEACRVLRPGGRLLIATVSHSRIKRHVTRLFPGLARIDLERFMPLPELKWHLRNQGLIDIRQGVMKTAKRTESVDDLVERFRRRYISTLALVPEKDFEKNLAIFEGRLRKIYGSTAETDVEIAFIGASKPG